MKTIHFGKGLLAVCLMAMACNKEVVVPEPTGNIQCDVQLEFIADVEPDCYDVTVTADSVSTKGLAGAFITKIQGESIEGADTKAAPVTSLTTYGAFSLFGYIYDSWSGSCKPEFMFGEKVTYDSGKWRTQNAFSSKTGGKTVRFYSFAPYGAEGLSVASTTAGPLSFAYTVPKAVSLQNDILVGSSSEYSGELSSVGISFSHCLCAVTFKTGTETLSGKIKSITLKGVYSTGTYTIGSGWSGLSGKDNFAFSTDTQVTEGQQKDLTGGESTMMLLPQTVPAGATLEVVVEYLGDTHTLSAPIAGDLWTEGRQCVYMLSFDSIAGMHISMDPTSLSLNWGEHKDIAITPKPSTQNWTNSISGTGLSAEKISSTVLRITNNNISGTDSNGSVTVTTEDRRRSATATISAKSLQESISLSPTSKTIAYGATETVSASGTYPNGFSLNSPTGVTVSKSGNTVSLKNTTASYTATDVTLTATTALMSRTASVSIHLSAKPETISLSKSSLSIGPSGTGTLTASGDYDSYTASLSSTTYATVSTSGNTITITNKNNTYESKSVTLTVKTAGDTKASASATITLEPLVDYVIGYEISAITLDKSSVGAGGGTVTVSGGAVTQKWVSGKSVANYKDASITVVRTSANSSYPASVSGKVITVNSLGKSVVAEGTYDVTVSFSEGGISATSRTASFKQGANNRYTGTKSTKNHTKTGTITYGSKSYGATTYGSKSYGTEYVNSTDWGTKVTDADTYGSWETTATSTEKYDYAVSLSVTSWSPGPEASSKANTVSASHYERAKYDQRRTITHNYHQPYTQHYYRKWTRSASRTYTRSASQNCNYVEYRTDTFDSGASEYVEENKSHTESWTDSGTETLADDTGSEWYRDNNGTSYTTADGGYGYQTTYGTGTKTTDSVTPTSSQSWLTYSSGNMNVSENKSTSSRSATLSVTNGSASASCSVTQSKAEYDIVIN